MKDAQDTKQDAPEAATKPVKIDRGDSPLARAQRNAYLSTKGILPGSPVQLDLAFPGTVAGRDGLRHIPNDYARSSLFTTRNKREPRRTLTHEKLFHYNEHVTLLYTGIELRAEDDELVFLQILKYSESVTFGQFFEFDLIDLVRGVNWPINGRNYDRARACISRLKANEVMALNTKAYGHSGVMSLIDDYVPINDANGKPTRYRMKIDPAMIVLFAGNTFTSHDWDVYRDLSPVARRLADHIDSHKHPYPLSSEKFRRICGSTNKTSTSWKQIVKKACAEVQAAGLAAYANVDDDGKIVAVRDEQPATEAAE